MSAWKLLPQSILCLMDNRQGKAKFLKQELRTWRAERDNFGSLPLKNPRQISAQISVKFTVHIGFNIFD